MIWVWLVLVLTVFIFIVLAVFFTLLSIIRGAPFVPSHEEVVVNMITLLDILPGKTIADLGSGGGGIVIAAAKINAEAHGYEINPLLVWWSRYKIHKEGVSDKAFIHWQNFWNKDLSHFGAITIFGINYIMKKLECKLKQELKPGAIVLSNAFTFPNWKYIKKEGSIYIYKRDRFLVGLPAPIQGRGPDFFNLVTL